MDKPNTSLDGECLITIAPNELMFSPPLNRVITNVLRLSNCNARPVGFKIKTTAPKRYCVRPNTGIISPNQSLEVQVILNCIKDAPPNLKCKDKFQVQAVLLDDDNSDMKEVWANLSEENIIKQRLKCHFGKPQSSTLTHLESPFLGEALKSEIPSVHPEPDTSVRKLVQPESTEDIGVLLTELQTKLSVISTERDELKKDVLKLSDELASSLKQQTMLRLRTSPSIQAAQSSTKSNPLPQLRKSNVELLVNQPILFLLVAFGFFLFGYLFRLVSC